MVKVTTIRGAPISSSWKRVIANLVVLYASSSREELLKQWISIRWGEGSISCKSRRANPDAEARIYCILANSNNLRWIGKLKHCRLILLEEVRVVTWSTGLSGRLVLFSGRLAFGTALSGALNKVGLDLGCMTRYVERLLVHSLRLLPRCHALHLVEVEVLLLLVLQLREQIGQVCEGN